MEILKIIVWHVKLMNSEFLIQMKIVVYVVLDFMIMGKKNVFYAEIQFHIANLAKITLNAKNVLIT